MENNATLIAFKELVDMGFAVATFAKKIGRDASTLYKWVDGSRQISKEVESEVANKIKEMKERFNQIII